MLSSFLKCYCIIIIPYITKKKKKIAKNKVFFRLLQWSYELFFLNALIIAVFFSHSQISLKNPTRNSIWNVDSIVISDLALFWENIYDFKTQMSESDVQTYSAFSNKNLNSLNKLEFLYFLVMTCCSRNMPYMSINMVISQKEMLRL